MYDSQVFLIAGVASWRWPPAMASVEARTATIAHRQAERRRAQGQRRNGLSVRSVRAPAAVERQQVQRAGDVRSVPSGSSDRASRAPTAHRTSAHRAPKHGASARSSGLNARNASNASVSSGPSARSGSSASASSEPSVSPHRASGLQRASAAAYRAPAHSAAERPQRVNAGRPSAGQLSGSTAGHSLEDAVRSIAARPSERQAPAQRRRRRSRAVPRSADAQMKFRDDRRIVAVGDRIDPVRYSSFVPKFYRALLRHAGLLLSLRRRSRLSLPDRPRR